MKVAAVKVAISGAAGRMGRTLIDALAADAELTLACAFDAAAGQAGGL